MFFCESKKNCNTNYVIVIVVKSETIYSRDNSEREINEKV